MCPIPAHYLHYICSDELQIPKNRILYALKHIKIRTINQNK